MDEFKVGDLIVYVNGDSYQIGKIKRVLDNGCFVYYHSGETAAKTPFKCMHKLINARDVLKTDLGGDAADELEDLQREKHEENLGEISDGYHTFNELYHHRAVLFSVICNKHSQIAWKSLHHHEGGEPMYDGMFIVGINTSSGQATYHYNIDPYWDMFDVPELDNAPKWDGHTPAEAIERIASLS